MVSIFGLGFGQIILIILAVLVLSAILFRRYFSALIYDYVFDGIFSFIDNFIFGLGLIGFDIGDWVGAFFIFTKQKKILGVAVALLVAWEATNFFPLSLIPGVGEAIEVFFNLFPAVFIATLLFNKYGAAIKEKLKLEAIISILEQLGLSEPKEKKLIKKISSLIDSADPVDALKESKNLDKEVSSKIRGYIEGLISETNNIIRYIASRNIQASQRTINILQQGINEAGQLMQQAQSAEEEQDFQAAINSAMNAKNAIISAAQQFDDAYQAELQSQQLQPAYAYAR